MAFVIVFLLNWPVQALAARGVPRGIAALLCLALGTARLRRLLVHCWPRRCRGRSSSSRESAPSALPKLELLVEPGPGPVLSAGRPGVDAECVAVAHRRSSPGWRSSAGNSAAAVIVSAGGGVATGFFDIFIALVIAFWALKDLPKMREEVLVISGPKYQDDAELLINTVTKVVGGYLKGQTIASLVTGTFAVSDLRSSACRTRSCWGSSRSS